MINIERKEDGMKKKIFGKIPLWTVLVAFLVLTLGGTAVAFLAGNGKTLKLSDEKARALLKSTTEISSEEEQALTDWLVVFLTSDREDSLEMNRELTASRGFEVGGHKTITGKGAFLFPKGDGGSVFKLNQGASFTMEGIKVDGKNQMGVGFNVQNSGQLTLKKGSIQGVTEYGVFASGKVELSDVSIEGSNSWIRLRRRSVGNLSNVDCFRSGNVGILVEEGATLNIDGADTVLERTNNSAVRNNGTFTMTGGKVVLSNGYGVENYGKLILTGVKLDTSRTGGSVLNEKKAEAVLKDCTFWNNKYHVRNSGTMTMSGCKLNASSSSGVYNDVGGVLDISDTFIYSSYHGIYNDCGRVTAKNIECQLMNSHGISNRGKNSEFKIDGLKVDMCISGINNIGDSAGAYGVVDARHVTVSRASSYNVVSYGGELKLADSTLNPSKGYNIYVRSGSALLDSVKILGTLTEGKGGISVGASTYPNVQVTIKGKTEITGCAARGIINYGKLTIYDCDIHDNNTSGKISDGAGIRSVGTVIMYGGKIHNNIAKNYGGAISLSELKDKNLKGKLYLHGGTICDNQSGKYGGAIYTGIPENVIEINGGSIYGNRTQGKGDGILVRGTLRLKNAESFKDNDICLLGDKSLIRVLSENLSFDEVKLVTTSFSDGRELVKFPNSTVAKKLCKKFVSRNSQFAVTRSIATGKLTNQIQDFDEVYDLSGATTVTVTTFQQLKEAVESTKADTSKVIRIGADITLTDNITQPAWTDIQLIDDGTARTLTRGSSGTLFTVSKECHLIFSGSAGLTLDGASESGRVAEKAMITAGYFGCFVMEQGAVLQNAFNTGTGSDTGVRGAAVNLSDDGRFLMKGGIMRNCSSPVDTTYDNSYSAVYVATSCGASVQGGTIADCNDRAFFSYGKVYMSGGIIDGCRHIKYGGAAFRGPVFVMTGGTIQNCVSTNSGSAVFVLPTTMVTEGYFKLDGGTITGNLVGTSLSSNANGGAIYISKDCKFDFPSGTVSNNVGGDEYIKMNVGGIYNAGKTTIGKNAKVIDNVATLSRAGIFNAGTMTINGALISGNRSTNVRWKNETHGTGAGVFNTGTLVMNGARVVDNCLGTTGTVYGSSGNITLKNMTFTGNTTTDTKGNDKGIDLRVAAGTKSATLSGKIVAVDTDWAFRLDLDKTFELADDFSANSNIKLYLYGKIYDGRKILEGKISKATIACFDWTNAPEGYYIGTDGCIHTDQQEAMIEETSVIYPTLEEAVEAAKAGETIKLLSDVNLEKQLKITKPITITTDGTADRVITSKYTGYAAIDLKPGTAGAAVLCGAGENSRLIIDGENTERTGPMVQSGGDKAVVNAGTFTNVIFKDCTTSYAGSALYVAYADATVENCRFENNESSYLTDSDAGGAAIYSTSTGKVSVKNSVFKGNEATNSGGAIYYTGIVYLDGCTFEGNVTKSQKKGGGAVCVAGKGGSIVNCVFTKNQAEAKNGGAIYLGTGISMKENTFTGNEAKEYGGAIYNYGTDDFKVTDSHFTENKAGIRGGAVYTTYELKQPVEISGSEFTGNSSETGGGAVYIASKNILNIKDSTFTKNTAIKGFGGAVAMGTSTSEMSLAGTVDFKENTAGDSAYGGGAIMAGRAFDIAEQAQVTFEKNTAATTIGGAVYMAYNADGNSVFRQGEGAVLTMSENTDKNGSFDIAAREGKAIDVILNGNFAIEGIYSAAGTKIELGDKAKDDTLDKPTVVKLAGEVAVGSRLVTGSTAADTIFEAECEDGSLALDKDGYFIRKGVAELGGVYYNSLQEAYAAAQAGDTILLCRNITLDTPLLIDKSVTIKTDGKQRTITMKPAGDTAADRLLVVKDTTNQCKVKFAGTKNGPLVIEGTGETGSKQMLMYFQNYGEVSMEYVTVRNAYRSGGAGGAIFHEKALTLTECTFENCKASYGGAIRGNGALTASDCTFTDCTATLKDNVSYGGGAISNNNGTVTLTGCSFNHCIGAYSGGAIYAAKAFTATDCNFKKCEAGYRGGVVYTSDTVILTNCEFEGNTAEDNGGAVYAANEKVIRVDGCTFDKNTSKNGSGGALAVGTSKATLNLAGKCTFTGNQAFGTPETGLHGGGAIQAPRNLYILTGAEIVMTGNECTGYGYGDAVSINAVTEYSFVVEANASLRVYDNPAEKDEDNDICLQKGKKVEPEVKEGGSYITTPPATNIAMLIRDAIFPQFTRGKNKKS